MQKYVNLVEELSNQYSVYYSLSLAKFGFETAVGENEPLKI